jgi:Ca2+-binding RTX toxin-like protein
MRLLAALLLILVLAPATAGAASIQATTTTVTRYTGKYMDEAYETSSTAVTLTAAPGEANRVALRARSGTGGVSVIASDAGAPLEAGPGCVVDATGAVTCSGVPGELHVTVELGDGADTYAGGGNDGAWVIGGDGDDTLSGTGGLSGGDGDDSLIGRSLYGGDGDDRLTVPGPRPHGSADLHGDAGDDRLDARMAGNAGLDGGSGRDELLGSPGSDLIDDGDGVHPDRDLIEGGGGSDWLSYEDRHAPLTVDLARGVGGARGERDVLRSIEEVTGGAGDDVLRGTASRDALRGGPGDDRLVGGRGRDELDGADGDDVLLLGPGRDNGDGGEGDDRIDGGPGADDIAGRGGADVIRGGTGADAIWPGESIDRVDTGPGRGSLDTSGDYLVDHVTCAVAQQAITADPGERLDPTCGTAITRPALRPLLWDELPGWPRAEVDGDAVHLWMDCMDVLDTTCRGSVVLRLGRRTIARGGFGCPPSRAGQDGCGDSMLAHGLRLAPDVTRLLRRRGRLAITVTTTLWPGRSRGALPVSSRAWLRPQTAAA